MCSNTNEPKKSGCYFDSYYNRHHHLIAFPDTAVLKNQYDAQIASGGWSFSDEREHCERLLGERFNFLLVSYSLIISAATQTTDVKMLLAILFVGTLLCAATTVTLIRAQAKLIVILKICYKLSGHPMNYVQQENEAREDWATGWPVNTWLGIWIPMFCTSSLIIAIAVILYTGWKPGI